MRPIPIKLATIAIATSLIRICITFSMLENPPPTVIVKSPKIMPATVPIKPK